MLVIQQRNIQMQRSEIEEMRILVRVDNIRFNVVIHPEGQYVIYGPNWMGLEDNILGNGTLPGGYMFPNLVRSIEVLIRGKLKT